MTIVAYHMRSTNTLSSTTRPTESASPVPPQVNTFDQVIPSAAPGQRMLSLLPSWHMYERSVEYFAAAAGIGLVYSAVAKFKDDLTKHPPHYFVAGKLPVCHATARQAGMIKTL